jgi:hypothetical protein
MSDIKRTPELDEVMQSVGRRPPEEIAALRARVEQERATACTACRLRATVEDRLCSPCGAAAREMAAEKAMWKAEPSPASTTEPATVEPEPEPAAERTTPGCPSPSRGEPRIPVQEPSGPGISVRRTRAWLRQIARALEAEPELAHERILIVRKALAPVVNNVLDIVAHHADDATRLAAAERVLAEIKNLIKPGAKALLELRKEAEARTETALRHLSPSQVQRELEGTWLFSAIRAALPVPVHLVDKVKTAISKALNGLERRDLLGSSHRQKVGQARDKEGKSSGHLVEDHRDCRGQPTPCAWCGRAEGRPPFDCGRCGKTTPSRSAVLCPSCEKSVDDPPFTCQCGTTIPRRYRRPPARRGGVTIKSIERAGGQTKAEIEARVHAHVEAGRLPDMLAEADGTPEELAVGLAFIAHLGDVHAAAASFEKPKKESTFRVLLARLAKKNPGPLARLLDPKAWKLTSSHGLKSGDSRAAGSSVKRNEKHITQVPKVKHMIRPDIHQRFLKIVARAK